MLVLDRHNTPTRVKTILGYCVPTDSILYNSLFNSIYIIYYCILYITHIAITQISEPPLSDEINPWARPQFLYWLANHSNIYQRQLVYKILLQVVEV